MELLLLPQLDHGQCMILMTKVGEATYSQSARISSSFLYPNNWRLALAHLKPHDGGLKLWVLI